jgi:hypothetical protein
MATITFQDGEYFGFIGRWMNTAEKRLRMRQPYL